MDLRTDNEKTKDEEHRLIIAKYREIFKNVGTTFKPWRICSAVSQYTKKEKMRGGLGYTAQSVKNIISNNL